MIKTMNSLNHQETVLPPRKKGFRGTWSFILILLVLGFSGLAFYFYNQLADLTANPQQIAEAEVEGIIAKVGELMFLPEGEEPTAALVTDPQALASQPFFARAKKGDWVLIYANAGKAILYDPSAHKIIDVGPVNIGQGTGQ